MREQLDTGGRFGDRWCGVHQPWRQSQEPSDGRVAAGEESFLRIVFVGRLVRCQSDQFLPRGLGEWEDSKASDAPVPVLIELVSPKVVMPGYSPRSVDGE